MTNLIYGFLRRIINFFILRLTNDSIGLDEEGTNLIYVLFRHLINLFLVWREN